MVSSDGSSASAMLCGVCSANAGPATLNDKIDKGKIDKQQIFMLVMLSENLP